MHKKFIYSILFLLNLLFPDCSDYEKSEIPDDLLNFLSELNLPDVQEIKIVYRVKNRTEDILFFKFSYGELQYDPAGSIYPVFYGLKNKHKIASLKEYDIDNIDSFFFQLENFEELKIIDDYVYYALLLPLLASDINTPNTTLKEIAELLYNYISAHIASLLLENPKVQNDASILDLLANLPVFQGDEYKIWRNKARELLDALSGKINPNN